MHDGKEMLEKLAEALHSNGGQVKFKDLASDVQNTLKALGFDYSDDDVLTYQVLARLAKELYKRKGAFPVHPLETEGSSDTKNSAHGKSKSEENASFEEQRGLTYVPNGKKPLSGTSLLEANEGSTGDKTQCADDEKGDLKRSDLRYVPKETEDSEICALENGGSSSEENQCAADEKPGTSMCPPGHIPNSEKKEVPRSLCPSNFSSTTAEVVASFLKKTDPYSKLLDGLRQEIKKQFKLSKVYASEVILLYLLDDNTPKTWSEVVQKLVEERYIDFNTARRATWEILGKKTDPSSRKKYIAVIGQKEDTEEFLYALDHMEYLRALDVAYKWITKTIKNLEELEESESTIRTDEEKILEFLENYVDDKGNHIYLDKLAEIFTVTGKKSIVIDYEHMLAMIPDIAHKLIEMPEDVIKMFEEVVQLLASSYFGKDVKLNVRICNLPTTLLPKDVDSSHLNRFIQVEGVVTRLSQIKPFVQKAVYVCKDCGREVTRVQRPYSSFEYKPRKCPDCGSRNIFRDNERSKFLNYQSLRLQDAPERLRGGAMPRYLDAILLDDLCDTVTPGDRVIVTGILKVVEDKSERRPVPKTVLVINNVTKLTKDIEEMELSKEDIQKIEEEARLAREGKINLKERMVKSIAPSIHGWEMEKLGLLLALFSGEDQKLPDGTTQRHRIHILLAGDPAVAKSHLLEFLEQVAPRANLRSGEGVSGPGLTAAVVKGEDGDWLLEAGVLVLSDKGYALIDELDKMNPDDRSRFHRAMEQGDIRISKAGINATLNARACVIAAANPKYGQWDRMKTLREQVDLPPTILSRFDLIFIMLDEPDEKRDEEIFTTIAKRWKRDREDLVPPYDPDFIRKYIVYAKKKIKTVELTEEAEEFLRRFYLNMRKEATKNDTLPITTRQAQALLRLAEAHARLHLRDKILKEDAEVAIKLMMYALSKSALDVDTGKIDMALIEFGKPLRELKKEEIIEDLIRRLEILSEYGAPKDDIITEAKIYELDKKDVENVLEKLMKEGRIYSPRPGYYRVSQE